jgi:SecD/SecF fusion protein
MALLRKTVLGLALAALLVVALLFGWRLYRHWTRPTVAKNGGTVLVYEVDPAGFPGGVPAPDFSPDRLAEALRRRLDPDDLNGIEVRPLGTNRIEVAVPRRADRPEAVQEVKDLVSRIGELEFRILANTRDDKEGIDAARDYFAAARDRPAEQEKLKAAAAAGNPPPGPGPPGGKAFHTTLGDFTYSWTELGPAQRRVYGLDNASEKTAGPGDLWVRMKEAREGGEAVEHDGLLFYSRAVLNPDRLPEKDRGKEYEYFLLTRDPERDAAGRPKAITGELLERADPAEDAAGNLAVAFRFNGEGRARLADLTTKNKPEGDFHRRLAIVLDGMIQSAPTLREPITGGNGQITGNYTKEEVDGIVNILRAGALPAPLKPFPVSEITFEPSR